MFNSTAAASSSSAVVQVLVATKGFSDLAILQAISLQQNGKSTQNILVAAAPIR